MASDQLQRAVLMHHNQHYREAIAVYRELLARSPQDAEISSLLGLAMAQSGQARAAIAYLENAVAREPGQIGFRRNLALGLHFAGLGDRARAVAEAVVAQDAGDFSAWELLGDLAAERGDPGGAASHWRRALGIRFSLPLAAKSVREQIRRHHFDPAIVVIAELLAYFPAEPLAHELACEWAVARRDWSALEKAARRMTARFTDHRDAWKWLAMAQFESGRYADSATTYRHILDDQFPNADESAAYAGLCLHALAFDHAEKALDVAEALDPDHPGMLHRRALLHLYRGRFAAAEECARRCLARQPGNVAAYTTLTRVRRGLLDDADLATLTRIVESADAPPDHRIPAAFAAGHVYDARGDVDAAMAAYRRAHELAQARDRVEGRSYDPAASDARAARLERQLDVPESAAPRPDAPQPIFIVGMPRSGTTLAEQLFAAHPRVAACGERMAMRQVLQAWLEQDTAGRVPDVQLVTAWRDAVLAGLPDLCGAAYFTDKHPLNFEAVGLIVRLFPDAPVLWMRRDPLETGLSCYRQEFNKRWGFVHRLADIGHYYRLHERVMERWVERLPGRIIEVRYETFAADFEHEAPLLVAAAGLDWDPRCLDFQLSDRPVATLSTVDVRDPVTVRRGRADRYRHLLDELVAALADGTA